MKCQGYDCKLGLDTEKCRESLSKDWNGVCEYQGHGQHSGPPISAFPIAEFPDTKSGWVDRYDGNNLLGSYKKIGKFIIHVQHCMECGDAWFLSVQGVFDRKELQSAELIKAKEEAINLFQSVLMKALFVLNIDVSEDETELRNQLDRWTG